MSKDNTYQITGWQACALTVMSASFGLRTAAGGFSGSWLAALFICIAVLSVPIFLTLRAMSRSDSLTAAIFDSFGSVAGRIIFAALGIYFTVQASVILSERTSTIGTFLLPDTPEQVVLLFAVLTATAIFYMGLQQIASTAELCTLLLIIPIAALLILGLSAMDVHRLLPLTVGNGFDLSAAAASARSFHGIEIFIFCLGTSKLAPRSLRKLSAAFILCALFLIVSFIICVGTFSIRGAEGLAYPLNEAFRVLNVGNITLTERFDLLFLIIDLIAGLVAGAAFMYCACLSFASSLKLDSHRSFIFTVVPTVFLLAYAITQQTADWYAGIADIGFAVIMFGLLPVLNIILITKRRKDHAS